MFSLALSCQNRYEQAVDAYKRALELDPNQESYKNNLKIAQEKVKELENAARNAFSAGAAAGAGGVSDYLSPIWWVQMAKVT